VRLDLAPLAADAILDLSTGATEGIAHGEQRIGKALVLRWTAVDIGLDATRQRDVDTDLEQAAAAMMRVRRLDHDMAGRHPAMEPLEGVDELGNMPPKGRARRGTLEAHSQRRSHDILLSVRLNDADATSTKAGTSRCAGSNGDLIWISLSVPHRR
jgi:hypothetical protein